MADPNLVVSTHVTAARLELLDDEEIRKLSCCRIISTETFASQDGHGGGHSGGSNSSKSKWGVDAAAAAAAAAAELSAAVPGGLHDSRMGVFDGRETCGTCGGSGSCPGHLGHIELELPVLNPILISSLVKLLRGVCLECRRVRLSKQQKGLEVKRFQLLQLLLLQELERMDSAVARTTTNNNASGEAESSKRRAQILQIFAAVESEINARMQQQSAVAGAADTESRERFLLQHIARDFSGTGWHVAAWRQQRNRLLNLAAATGRCSHCGVANAVSVHLAPKASGVELRWPWHSALPYTTGGFFGSLFDGGARKESREDCEGVELSSEGADLKAGDTGGRVKPDEGCLKYSRTGKATGSVELHGFQLLPLVQMLFEREEDRVLLAYLFPMTFLRLSRRFIFGTVRLGPSVFFQQAVAVSANRFRPPTSGASRGFGGSARQLLHPRTQQLQDIVRLNEKLRQAAPPGIRQWMERKAGAIRQRMQGKRVNFAARTVLAPDGLLAANEVAVPLEFAMKLSVPEAVTAFNAAQLSMMVRNGPKRHPGALGLQDDRGNTYNLEFMSESARAAKAAELEAFASAGSSDGGVFRVYRHLLDGDVVLMNRQPSLHRLSLMAHFVKVARPLTPEYHFEKEFAERVFRINFVNCSSYNADFDGDEMNLHVPQDAVARAEACQILNADCQFTVPKNGDLVRGLIQDYCLAGALLTCRDTFFSVHEYQTLVYAGLERYLRSLGGGLRITLDRSKDLDKCFSISSSPTKGSLHGGASGESTVLGITHVDPAVLWPRKLWTGKQVITAILKTLVDGIARSRLKQNALSTAGKNSGASEAVRGYRGINLQSKSKTPGDAWGGAEDGDKEEATVVIRESELLQGVFDKNQFGCSSGGLLHCVYLLLGSRAASMLLQALGALFACFLKFRGATTSPADFVLRMEGMQQRQALIERVVGTGTFLQEHFVSRISTHLGCSADLAHQRLQQRLATASAAHAAVSGSRAAAGEQEASLESATLKAAATEAAAEAFKSCGGEGGLQRRKHALLQMAAAAAGGGVSGVPDECSAEVQGDAAAAATVLAEKLALTKFASPLLQQQLPRVARILQTQRLLPLYMQPVPCKGHGSKAFEAEGAGLSGEALKAPPPNVVVALPDGGSIEGSTRWLRPKLYHPSWLWRPHAQHQQSAAAAFASGTFESPARYVLQTASDAAAATAPNQRVLLAPSILTQERLSALMAQRFKGRLSELDELLDSFFQGSMGKVASQSTDIMRGRYFLYPFPRNGFAAMIKTGAKGSNVNYAMICVFLGQQSLEGRRVKPMSSGRSLPAFAPGDFGSLARGFVLSSFLTGLREEEFYFHCMAGREGLIDTAVKTAKSGYLQRSLMKSLEGLYLAYDGSVRDSDGSVLQFVYADDGRDATQAATLQNLQVFTENPYLLKWLNKPPRELQMYMHRKRQLKREHEKQQDSPDVKVQEEEAAMEKYLRAMESQPFNSPLSALGTTSYLFEKKLKDVVESACGDYAHMRRWFAESSSGARRHRKQKQQQCAADGIYRSGLPAEELETLLRVAFHKGCMQPGEAVGVIAAQSIGEPATQMTLNTFHLAGHGAANVTMGIPRLRELLQLGAKTKTPQIRIPIRRGTEHLNKTVAYAIATSNAATALRGFTTIRMQDFVHAVGVEANVYYQGPDSLMSFPEAKAFMTPSSSSSRLYWEYEVTIQLEALQHFCSVARQFNPDDLLLLVINKVAKKLMVASVAQYEWSEAPELQSDLQQLYRAFLLKDRNKSQWERRAAVKDILRAGRINCEAAAGGALDEEGSGGPSQGGSRNVAPGNSLEEDNSKGVWEANAGEDEGDGPRRKSKSVREADGEENDNDGSGGSDDSGEEEESEDDASEAEAGATEGEEGLEEEGEEQETTPDKDEEGSESSDSDEDAVTARNVKSGGDLKVKREDKEEIDGPRGKRVKKEKQEDAAYGSEFKAPPLLDLAEALRGKKYDKKLRMFVTDDKADAASPVPPVTPTPAPFEEDAIWSCGKTMKGVSPLDLESAAILHDLKVCRKTWRVVVKFGWPVDKCPYRLELLPLVKGLVEKVVLQEPRGVSDPRIVQGSGCVTGSPLEVHCSGTNLQWIHRLKETAVDHNRLNTNDVLAVLKFYGVEAARALFLKELSAVFSAYGIHVHSTHLGLVADFVTREGNITPFNRLGIQSSSSPFLQMAFETSFKFLTEACERAAVDTLQSPSAALIVGSPAAIGSQQSELLAVLPDFTDS
ncbi:DNA-directed RNA polymerase I largest subunit [Cyclospora cayetanensis]|uniref:DNA-directed RNA polymerase subunit n=1 Tax=Cyclospora cayetanensis TaxID=88456 RepID=A0A1D3CZ34_9EIME|nr:DNA-directed RNA polymerase I largest subunit [Cyclospora cayetanensis]